MNILNLIQAFREAAKQFKKMDRSIAAFILSFIEEKLVTCENPRAYGKADQLLVITVVEVGITRVFM